MEKSPNILKYYLIQILIGFSFFLPVIVLFWQENGLSLAEIMVLQALFSIWVVILEVPTGFFADVLGRKISIVMASIAFLGGIVVYSIGYNFWHFLVAEFIWGLAVSLMSGADSAFIYDTLLEEKREHMYRKVEGVASSLNMVSIAFASVIGGLVGSYSYRYTFYCMIPFFLAAIPVSLSLKEPKRHMELMEKGYFHKIYKILRFALYKNKELRWVLLFSSVILAFDSVGLWFYQPYMKLSGLSVFWFGFVFAGFNLFAALSSHYAHDIEVRIGKAWSLFLLLAFMALAFFLLGNFVFVFGFVFIFLLQFVRGFSRPVTCDYVNSIVWSDKRATVLSLKNLLRRLLFAIVSPFIGWFADVYSLADALKLSALIILVLGLFSFFMLQKAKLYK